MRAAVGLVATGTLASLAAALCPFADTGAVPPPNHPVGHPPSFMEETGEPAAGGAAAATVDWNALKSDVIVLFTDSHDSWPADYGTYAPFFVRLAWHCSGSYRTSDGRGGCDGGRQRFEPERSWADNTNLDKARRLLRPLKMKYGDALSWGDLFIFTGTTAVEHMGGPVLGFCAGRVDAADGSESVQLGPSPLQEELFPCKKNGECVSPLGSSTVGLIYIDPTGPDGVPLPVKSAPQVRDTFGRMNMNDTETVALIGGGHAFGKTHGACPAGPGVPPNVDPINPWQGKCGNGKGVNAFTSGMEGPWTTNPTRWDNEYFKHLLKFDWEVFTGPGGKPQWRINGSHHPMAPSADLKSKVPIRMMTTDVSLVHDDIYYKIVRKYANDQRAFNKAFAHAWYKLTSRDMGPRERCVGPDVPPAQPWQNPLPSRKQTLPDFDSVRRSIVEAFRSSSVATALFVRLAWQCASTIRSTDYLGGCNGARIRFAPQRDWPENKNLDTALAALNPVKKNYGEALSWGDLIVLAGNVAIEEAGGLKMPFCPGRADALNGDGSGFLESRLTPERLKSGRLIKDVVQVMGLSMREFTVLIGGGHTLGRKHAATSGFTGAWTADPTVFSNSYFTTLVSETWDEKPVKDAPGASVYVARGRQNLTMLGTDLLMLDDPAFATFTQEYALDNALFLNDFRDAWTRLMNKDRYDGPEGNLCDHKCNTVW